MKEGNASSNPLLASREERFRLLASQTFDVLVVGGGITGAAIARHAACAGLRVALVEQGDFASGTSSRSSRLIHGGLRYLKSGQVGLVYRAQREQQRLANLAPHLVKPLRILFPLYGRSFLSRWAHRGGMRAYRVLQPFDSRPRHGRVRAEEMLAQEPYLYAGGLQGGFVCHEFITHDARLVWETTLAAEEAGACVVNYARVEEFLTQGRERVCGVALRDLKTERLIEVRARVAVSAAGPWSDVLLRGFKNHRMRLRLTKGVHIILPRRRLPLSQAVIFPSLRDARPLVAIPTENLLIVGPTETDFGGRPEEASPEIDDVEYLLDSLREFFAAEDLGPADVIEARAGLRPLYDQPARSCGEVSRAYHIEWQREGLLSVLGGKLTLHRRAASEVLRLLSRELDIKGGPRPPNNVNQPLPGGAWRRSPESLSKNLRDVGLAEDSVNHLIRSYGSRAQLVVGLLAEEPAHGRRITPGLPHIFAEAVFSIRYEMATCTRDFYERRSDLALRAKAEGERLPAELARFWHAAPETGATAACALTTRT